MKTLLNRRFCFICVQLLALPAFAHSPADEMAAAANNFLAALTKDQQVTAVFPFKDDERFDWHFIPKPRKGLPFKDSPDTVAVR